MYTNGFYPAPDRIEYARLRELLIAGTDVVLTNQAREIATLRVGFCKASEFDKIMALQKRVYDAVREKDTFVLTTGEELAESLELDTCIGAYQGTAPAAFTLMVTNPYSSRNLGLYLGYSPERCAKCVTYDTTFVDPAYKGFGLQRLFITLKDALARGAGAEEALATVSPDNEASLKNLLASGFSAASRKNMYGSYDRLILRKPLAGPVKNEEGG